MSTNGLKWTGEQMDGGFPWNAQPSLCGGEGCRADQTVMWDAIPLPAPPARGLFHSVPELKHLLCRCPLRDCPRLGTVIKEHWETGMGSHLRCFARSGSFFLWLHWVFLPAHGLSLVEVSGGYSSLRCTGFSLQCLLLWSTGSKARRLSSCGARL